MRHDASDHPRTRRGPPRAASTLVLAVVTLALASCGRLVVLADDPWWGSLAAGSPSPVRQVALAGLKKGYWPTFVAVGEREDAGERLEAALADRRTAAAVIGPPLSSGAGGLAARHSDVRFILVGGMTRDDGIANTVQLVFDRTAAFREAGRMAAKAGRTAVLTAAGRPDSETEAFIAGVGEVDGAAVPVMKALGDRPDTPSLKIAVSVLREQGIAVFLYRPTGSRAAFLDVMAAAGGSAVVEDWAAARPRPAQVLASIEEDLASGLGACLARGAPAVVSGPVRVARGEAKTTAEGGRR